MNLNAENHYQELPHAEVPRSIIDLSQDHVTACNIGELIPFYCKEILPGETCKVSTSFVGRLQTLLTPIMGNIVLDIAYFFTPNRILWEHWINFMGESDRAWMPSVQYSVPKISSPSGGWNVGTIADYLGIPPGVDLEVSALPFRAYAMICDQWYRDENLTDPLVINYGDSNVTGSNGSTDLDVPLGGAPFKAAKLHDALTSALPAPQRGPSVTFDLLSGSMAPVGTGTTHKDPAFGAAGMHFLGLNYGSTGWSDSSAHVLFSRTDSDGQGSLVGYDNNASETSFQALVPTNLWADLSTSLGAVSINDLRLAFQMQKFYERSARGGTRYREILESMFSVHSPDARMMIPEYLGGHRVPLSIHQITNTSETSTASLGDVGAMSNTSDVHQDFIKSFVEHGWLIGVATVRYIHSYPQGLHRMFSRFDKFDFYWPVLSSLGEMPIYKKEICATGTSSDNDVFGYQEAWYSYRYFQNRCSSEMRPGVPNSLASWHLADYYTSVPTLSDSWIREDKNNVDRVLAVGSSVAKQFFADFYVQNIATLPMPVYSVPGLIDHF